MELTGLSGLLRQAEYVRAELETLRGIFVGFADPSVPVHV